MTTTRNASAAALFWLAGAALAQPVSINIPAFPNELAPLSARQVTFICSLYASNEVNALVKDESRKALAVETMAVRYLLGEEADDAGLLSSEASQLSNGYTKVPNQQGMRDWCLAAGRAKLYSLIPEARRKYTEKAQWAVGRLTEWAKPAPRN